MPPEGQNAGGVYIPLGVTYDPSGVAAARRDFASLESTPLRIRAQVIPASGAGGLTPGLSISRRDVASFRADINAHMQALGTTGQGVTVPIKLGRINYAALRAEIAAGIGVVPVQVSVSAGGAKAGGSKLLAAAVAEQTGTGLAQSEQFITRAARKRGVPVEGRAHGGPVFPGRDYLVGEKGPEIFRPKVAGKILPRPTPKQLREGFDIESREHEREVFDRPMQEGGRARVFSRKSINRFGPYPGISYGPDLSKREIARLDQIQASIRGYQSGPEMSYSDPFQRNREPRLGDMAGTLQRISGGLRFPEVPRGYSADPSGHLARSIFGLYGRVNKQAELGFASESRSDLRRLEGRLGEVMGEISTGKQVFGGASQENVVANPFGFFHATTDIESVLKHGLLSGEELRSSALGSRSGLGGRDDKVSLTWSLARAQQIASSLRMAGRVARDEARPSQVANYFTKRGIKSEDELTAFLAGTGNRGGSAVRRLLSAEPGLSLSDALREARKTGTEDYFEAFKALDFVTSFGGKARTEGVMFFGLDADKAAKIRPENIGVVQAAMRRPRRGEQIFKNEHDWWEWASHGIVPGEYEMRIPSQLLTVIGRRHGGGRVRPMHAGGYARGGPLPNDPSAIFREQRELGPLMRRIVKEASAEDRPLPEWMRRAQEKRLPYREERRASGGSGWRKGSYLVNEIGEELYVPGRLAHVIPPHVMSQLPKREDGGIVKIKGGPQMFTPPEDGWIIPARLRDQVPMRAEGGDIYAPFRGPGGRFVTRPPINPATGQVLPPDAVRAILASAAPAVAAAAAAAAAAPAVAHAAAGAVGAGFGVPVGAAFGGAPAPTAAAIRAARRMGVPVGAPFAAGPAPLGGAAIRAARAAGAVPPPPPPAAPPPAPGPVFGPPRVAASGGLTAGAATLFAAGAARPSKGIITEESQALRDAIRGAQQALPGRTIRGAVSSLGSLFFGGRGANQADIIAAQRGIRQLEIAQRKQNDAVGEAVTARQRLQAATAAGFSPRALVALTDSYRTLRGEAAAANVRVRETRISAEGLAKRAVPTPANILQNIAAIGVATAGYGLLTQGISTFAGTAVPAIKTVIDTQQGFAAAATKVTGALADQTVELRGNVRAAVASAAATGGLNKEALAFVQTRLAPTVTAKAGAASQQQASDLIRASIGVQAVPQGLFGGYGGLGNSPLLADVLGGGKGFTEIIAGTLGDLAQRSKQTPQTALPPGQSALSLLLGGVTPFAPSPETDAATTRAADLSRKAMTVYADNVTAEAQRGAGYLAQTSTNLKLARDESAADQAAFADIGAAAGDAANSANLAKAGFVLLDKTTGKLVTSAEQYTQFFKQASQGAGLQDIATFLAQQKQGLAAQFAATAEQARFQRQNVIPAQLGFQLLQQPLLPPAAGVLPSSGISGAGLSPDAAAGVQRSLDLAGRYQTKLNEEAQHGLEIARQTVIANGGNVEVYDSAIKSAAAYTSVIGGLQAKISFRASTLEAQQFNLQMFYLRRNLSDAKGLAGELTGPQNLGALQRQSTMIGFQQTQLGLGLQQRQVTTQLATAQFGVSGDTPEIRAARQQEAILNAKIAQRQLDLSKQQFGVQKQEFNVGAERGVSDAQKAIEITQAARDTQVAIAADEKALAAAQALQGQAMAKAQTEFSAATSNFGAKLSAAADAAAQGIGTLAGNLAALNAEFKAILQPEELRGQWTPYGVGAHAMGAIGMTTGPQRAIMGEAGTEAYAILRNPRVGSISTGGGVNLGGITVVVNGGGSGDVESLKRAVTAGVMEALDRKGSLLNLRGPSY